MNYNDSTFFYYLNADYFLNIIFSYYQKWNYIKYYREVEIDTIINKKQNIGKRI